MSTVGLIEEINRVIFEVDTVRRDCFDMKEYRSSLEPSIRRSFALSLNEIRRSLEVLVRRLENKFLAKLMRGKRVDHDAAERLLDDIREKIEEANDQMEIEEKTVEDADMFRQEEEDRAYARDCPPIDWDEHSSSVRCNFVEDSSSVRCNFVEDSSSVRFKFVERLFNPMMLSYWVFRGRSSNN
jgi:hypothetical protein